MMQAQLNPYFLCNTLDTMKWISKINQVPQVALMSTNLADILRFCISPDEFVGAAAGAGDSGTVCGDSAHPAAIGQFYVCAGCAGGAFSCMVPKMMLQPLAENAILHGLSGVPDGRLSVTARESEGRCFGNSFWTTAVAFRGNAGGRIRRRRSRRGIWGF